jgi:hypothetical protein
MNVILDGTINIRFFLYRFIKKWRFVKLNRFFIHRNINFFEYFQSSPYPLSKACKKSSFDPSATYPLKKPIPFMKRSDLPKQFMANRVQYSNKDLSNSLLMRTHSYPITIPSIMAPVPTKKNSPRTPEPTD